MFKTLYTTFNRYYDALIAPLGISKWWDGLDRNSGTDRQPLTRADLALAVVLGLIALSVSLWGFEQTSRAEGINTYLSIFLQADIGRVAENLVTTSGNHARTSVHPIASILLYPFGAFLTLTGLAPLTAAKVLVVTISALNAALFSLILRLLGLPRLIGGLFTLLFISSACFVFWSSVIELFPFACFSILLALFLMFRICQSTALSWITANVLTLGLTTPNWIFGIIATAVRQKLKPFLLICTAALGFVGVVSIIQNPLFEKAAYFFNPIPLMREANFTQPAMQAQGSYETGWQPLNNLRSLYVTTIIAMPATIEVQNSIEIVTTNQTSGFPTGELSPVIATVAWVILFGLGVWGAIRHRLLRLPLIGVGLMLLFQSLLHSVYGEVTFLYSLHYLPLLVLIAACAWFTPFRHIAAVLTTVVIVFGTMNNIDRLQSTIDTAGCLSQLDSVKTYQSWDIIKTEPSRDTRPDYSPLSSADVERCQAL